MAFKSLRTEIIVLVLNIIVKTLCDSEVRPQVYMDDIKVSDHGRSGDERGDDLTDLAIPVTTIKDTEPEKVFRETDSIDLDIKIKDNVETQNSIPTKTSDATTEPYPTTTDVPEEMPEALGLKNNDVKKLDADYKNPNMVERSDNDADSVEVSVTSADATEAATDGYTLSISDVYKTRENVIEDINTNSTSNNVEPTKAEITTTTQTLRDDMDSLNHKMLSTEEDTDVPGQRNPKTDNIEPKQQMDKRNYETKSRAPPTVSKSSTLKGWLEDSWIRPPAGILVPLRPMALNRALAVWKDLTAVEGLNVSDIVIVGYDSNGVNWRSRHNLQGGSVGSGNRAVSEALSKLLLKYQGVHNDATGDGTMRALASAAKLVPYDSALFVVTDKGAGDPQRLPLALRALVEKRLKVYTIWTDPRHPSIESDLALQELKNISKHTEGDVLPYSLQVMDMDAASNLASDIHRWDPTGSIQSRRARLNSKIGGEEFDTLLVRRGGGGAISLGVPVENGVSALRIFIEGAVEHAVLYPPNDAPQIDLFNATSVRSFSPSSKTGGTSPRDIYLIFPGAKLDSDTLLVLPASLSSTDAPAATVGVWHLSVRCDTDYRLCIGARSHIHFDATIQPRDMLKLRVSGPVASVRQSLLVDEYGTELAKLPFSYQPIAGDVQKEPADGPEAELVADVPYPRVKGSKIYAKIVGRDVRGEPFVRLSGPLTQQSEVRMGRSASIVFSESLNDLERAEETNSMVYNNKLLFNESAIVPLQTSSQVLNQRGSLLTTVQIGLSTKLYGAPGDNLQLHFEVTNYRDQAVRFSFSAVGQLKFLRGINPSRATVAAGQTVNVIVSVGITSSAQTGVRDLITFTASGLDTVSLSAYVYVVSPSEIATDFWSPDLRHNFQGSCIGRMGNDCAQHIWSATVIARDALGGLLRLSSSPIGVIYDNSFVSGSRDEVIATYRATCCAPRVMITAVDAYGNANSYVVDISNYFSEAAIAAIVLGVILAIAIIVLIAFLIFCCVKRRRESRELPSFTTSSSRNIN